MSLTISTLTHVVISLVGIVSGLIVLGAFVAPAIVAGIRIRNEPDPSASLA